MARYSIHCATQFKVSTVILAISTVQQELLRALNLAFNGISYNIQLFEWAGTWKHFLLLYLRPLTCNVLFGWKRKLRNKTNIYNRLDKYIINNIFLIHSNYISTNIEWEGLNRTVCQVEIAFWISNYVGENVYFSSYFLFRVFFVHLIPCIVLVLLNMCLFRAMRNAQKKRQKLFDKCAKKSKKANDKNSTTLMLIIIVTIFLIVEIPLALITGLHVLSQLTNHFLDYRMANQFILFANFFLLVSYPINFVIYIKMSRVFRETAKMFMFWRPAPSPSGNATIGNVQSSRYSVVNGARTCTNETVL